MRQFLAAALLLASPSAALACSNIADDAERLACYDARYSAVTMIRCVDLFGHASCEVLSPEPGDLVSCVAFNGAGEPIARGMGTGGSGVVLNGLDASNVDHMDCEVAL